MEVTALCFRVLVTEFILLGTQVKHHYSQKSVSDAAFLRISSNRQQHFEYESVSLHCEGMAGSPQLRWISNMMEFKPKCHFKTAKSLSCSLDALYKGDSGEYWCETEGGERSNRVNITVTDGSVILESPVHPVMEGQSVTLRCRSKTTSTNLHADFYKDGRFIMESRSAEIIRQVSKSDEGMYKCSIHGVGGSPESWLTVRARRGPSITPSPREDSHPDDSDLTPVIVLWATITISVVALALLLGGFLYVMKPRGSLKTQTSASRSGDDGQNVFVEDAEDDSVSVTYTVVFTKPREAEDAADSAENKSPESNQSTKPQREGDDEESFYSETIYSALAISETPQTLQHESGSSSSTVTLNSTEQEVFDAPV